VGEQLVLHPHSRESAWEPVAGRSRSSSLNDASVDAAVRS
jgi:hypothetical protein